MAAKKTASKAEKAPEMVTSKVDALTEMGTPQLPQLEANGVYTIVGTRTGPLAAGVEYEVTGAYAENILSKGFATLKS